jgi:hypothetical protein
MYIKYQGWDSKPEYPEYEAGVLSIPMKQRDDVQQTETPSNVSPCIRWVHEWDALLELLLLQVPHASHVVFAARMNVSPTLITTDSVFVSCQIVVLGVLFNRSTFIKVSYAVFLFRLLSHLINSNDCQMDWCFQFCILTRKIFTTGFWFLAKCSVSKIVSSFSNKRFRTSRYLQEVNKVNL